MSSISQFRREWIQCSVLLVLLLALSEYAVHHGPASSPGIENVRLALSGQDQVSRPLIARPINAGYYQALTQANWANEQLWTTLRRESFPFVPLHTATDFRWNQLPPNIHGKYLGVDFSTNRWGMRDRDHELIKAPNTLRLALLGSSHTVGYGVPENDMFVHLVETELNQKKKGNFEIINFSIPGAGPLGQIEILKKSVKRFAPDIVLFVGHSNDLYRMNRDVQGGAREHFPNTFPFLKDVLREANVNENTTVKVANERLHPYEAKMLSFTYQKIAQQCKSVNALPVYVFLPVPGDLPISASLVNELLGFAKRAGFITIDLSRIYLGMNPKDLMVPPEIDSAEHSNARANKIIAARLLEQLMANPKIDLINRAHHAAENMADVSRS